MSTELPKIGKISPAAFDEIVFPRLGSKSKNVIVGPQHGVDCGIVDLGNDQVMAITTDPFFVVPAYGWERAAWFAFHIIASDVTTSGLAPTYFVVDLNLPPSITAEELDTMWSVVHEECVKYDISIIAGHTAKYDGCNYPMVGGATMISIGARAKYVTTKMAKPGDKIIITKGAAIEASGLFAATFPDLIAEKHGDEFANKAQDLFWKMTTVDDSLAAVSVGTGDNGVTTLHDATECGIWGGLYEIAKASGVGMRISKDDIIVLEEADKICAQFGMDPYSSISEGTLLVTCREQFTSDILEVLSQKGIESSVVGDVTEEKFGVKLVSGGREQELEHPEVDPFWEAFATTMEQSLASK